MNQDALAAIAAQMVKSGTGVLAADESHATCKKRFDAIGVEFSEESRRSYRQILVATDGSEEYVSGIILFDETIRQATDDGTPFTEILAKKGILPGIKVDTGAKDLALHPGEKTTEGLDGLRDRLKEYANLGAKFAKWRAVITIDVNNGLPSSACIHANAHGLARYAALCQEAGIVPMVEPEVLINGSHTADDCEAATRAILKKLYKEMADQDIYLPGTILKTSMVIAGTDCSQQLSYEEVADRTVACLRDCVPAEVGGIVFLSGGQTEVQSSMHLSLMNSRHQDLPWNLSFSYGRAIQQPVLTAWAAGNTEEAEKQLLHRSKMNSLATLGEYSEALES